MSFFLEGVSYSFYQLKFILWLELSFTFSKSWIYVNFITHLEMSRLHFNLERNWVMFININRGEREWNKNEKSHHPIFIPFFYFACISVTKNCYEICCNVNFSNLKSISIFNFQFFKFFSNFFQIFFKFFSNFFQISISNFDLNPYVLD